MKGLHTRFVLIQPSHAGNVGAVARAIKVMGFNDLALVAPRWPDVLKRAEAIERASGAADVLKRAHVVDTLDEALAGMTHLCATVMTPRDFGPPTWAPREYFPVLLKPWSPPAGVAFLFGSERYGMSNDDVYRCHAALSIPSNPQYGSLNLAAAVQLIAYDWRQALTTYEGGSPTQHSPGTWEHVPADVVELSAMLAHWQEALAEIGFLDPVTPRKLMPRLRQLFNRAQLSHEEIQILRGIARAMWGSGKR